MNRIYNVYLFIYLFIFPCLLPAGRRLTLAAALCVATAFALCLLLLSAKQLSSLQAAEEDLQLYEQLRLLRLRQTLQEKWSNRNYEQQQQQQQHQQQPQQLQHERTNEEIQTQIPIKRLSQQHENNNSTSNRSSSSRKCNSSSSSSSRSGTCVRLCFLSLRCLSSALFLFLL